MLLVAGRAVAARCRPVEHAVLVVLVASGSSVADVAPTGTFTSHAVAVRLRHVVTYIAASQRRATSHTQIGLIEFAVHVSSDARQLVCPLTQSTASRDAHRASNSAVNH